MTDQIAQLRAQNQALQDMLEVVVEQRDIATGTVVELGAKLKAAQRTIKQLEERQFRGAETVDAVAVEAASIN